MNAIINPFWFYLIDVGDTLKCLLVVISVPIIVFTVIYLLATADTIDCFDFEFCQRFLKKRKKILAISLVAFFLGLIIPSDETSYKMMIASQVTPNNIEIFKEDAKSLVDYIVEAADKISNGESEEK